MARATFQAGPPFPSLCGCRQVKVGGIFPRSKPVLSPAAGPNGRDGFRVMSLLPSRCRERCCDLPCPERKFAAQAVQSKPSVTPISLLPTVRLDSDFSTLVLHALVAL